MGFGPPSDLVDRLCHRVLDEIVSYYDDEGFDLPDRRYVSPGEPPWDCDQVTVNLAQTKGVTGSVLNEAGEANPMAAGFAMIKARLTIQVVRCVPTWATDLQLAGPASLPPIAEDEAVSTLMNADTQVVTSALLRAMQADRLPNDPGDAVFLGSTIVPFGDKVGTVVMVEFGVARLVGILADGS